MNIAIVLLVVCAAAVEILADPHGHHGEKIRQYTEECIESDNVDRELVKASKNGEAPPDQKVKCMYACVSKKMKVMNEDGTINKEKFNIIPPHIPEEKREEFVEARSKCADKIGEDECDTAWLITDCMRSLMKLYHRKHSSK